MSAEQKPTRECANALLHAAQAFKGMHDALDKAQEALTKADSYWLMQYGVQANMHHTQGRAYVSTARDLGAGEDLLRMAAGGDLRGLEGRLLR